MTRNSALCAANPNISYVNGAGAAHSHAPTSICGAVVSYDANGIAVGITVTVLSIR